MLNLVLYQPDIAQNLGAVLRVGACMAATVHSIEPCGFAFTDQKLRRAGMDYMDKVKYVRHMDWAAFLAHRARHPGRLLLLETDGATRISDMVFARTDYVMLGRESAGTPRDLYATMDATLTIPMAAGMRSLNVAMAAGMVVAEAARQMKWEFAA